MCIRDSAKGISKHGARRQRGWLPVLPCLLYTSEKVRGQALASLCGMGGISNIIGASLGGVVIDQLGVNALLYLFAGFSLIGFLLMGIVASLHNKKLISISLES